MTKIIPLMDRALIKVPELNEKTAGGLILPAEYRDKHSMAQLEAEVIAVAEFFFQDYKTKPKVGDTVLITKYAGLIYHIDGEEYRIVEPRDILGIKQ